MIADEGRKEGSAKYVNLCVRGLSRAQTSHSSQAASQAANHPVTAEQQRFTPFHADHPIQMQLMLKHIQAHVFNKFHSMLIRTLDLLSSW